MAIMKGAARRTFATVDLVGTSIATDVRTENRRRKPACADRLIAHIRTMAGDVALFSHGQFGTVLAARWIGLEVIEGRHFSIGPASLSLLSYDVDHAAVPVIGLWNAAPGCCCSASSR